MILALAVLVGVLFAAGTYLLIQRTLTRIILGVSLYGHAVNVLLLASGGRSGRAPILDGSETGRVSDPLPQAMALTAIVISFAVVAFLLALAYRNWTHTGDDEVEDDLEDRRIAAFVPIEPDREDEDDDDRPSEMSAPADRDGGEVRP